MEKKYFVAVNEIGTFWFSDEAMTIFHREDGPAVEYADGDKEYYYQDEEFPSIKTNEQWKKHLKWMKFS